jgi:hypothetical protein
MILVIIPAFLIISLYWVALDVISNKSLQLILVESIVMLLAIGLTTLFNYAYFKHCYKKHFRIAISLKQLLSLKYNPVA